MGEFPTKIIVPTYSGENQKYAKIFQTMVKNVPEGSISPDFFQALRHCSLPEMQALSYARNVQLIEIKRLFLNFILKD